MPISSPVVAVVLRHRDRPGQPEVGDLDPAVVGDQHVLGLDVAVHDAGPVRRVQRGQHRLHHVERLPRVQPPALAEQVAQGARRRRTPSPGRRRPSSLPWSNTATTLGCDSRAAALASRMNRATNSASSASEECITLMATGRSSRMSTAAVDRGHPAAGDALLDAVPAVEHPPDERVSEGRVHAGDPTFRRAQHRSTTASARPPTWGYGTPPHAQWLNWCRSRSTDLT